MTDKLKSKKSKSRTINEDIQKKTKKVKIDKDDMAGKIADVFNHDWLLNENDRCALCKGSHEVGILLNKNIHINSIVDEELDDFKKSFDPDGISDINAIWASKYSLLHKKQRLFFHLQCAERSPQVSYDGKKWYGLKKEYDRGSRLPCTYCGKNGATLGCIDKKCNVNMHIPCAVNAGFRITGFKYDYYCDKHLEAMRLKDIEADKLVKGDISNGHEPIPITISNSSDISKIMKEFKYTKENVDSHDVTMNTRNIDTDCCKCEGLCDDVATCECLAAFGRNYTFTGSLIPGSTNRRILECNLRCSCSIRRCTNRVVEKGPTSRLQVFRPSNTTSSSSTGDATSNSRLHPVWGVRTLDFIPEGQFVCEVTGQYVLGRTVEDNTTTSGSPGSSHLNEQKSVVDVIMQDPSIQQLSPSAVEPARSGSADAHHLLPYTTRIIPIGAWEESGSGESEAFAPLAWAVKEASVYQNYASSTAAATVVVDKLTEEHYDSIRNFLRGEICIDSRRFGNIGSLIRRLPPPGPVLPITTTSSNGSGEADASLPGDNSSNGTAVDRMLMRRLVFTNNKTRYQQKGLKLALFAARNIPAGSELFI